MKNVFAKVAALALVALAASCGSQLVQFPEECDCPPGLPGPDSGEVEDTAVPPVDTALPPEDTDVPAEDTGTPQEDTSVPVEDTSKPSEDTSVPPVDSGKPSEDTGTPQVDSGKPVEDTGVKDTGTVKDTGKPDDGDCDDDKKCEGDHKKCVSACECVCKAVGGKHHKSTCHAYEHCMAACTDKCDCTLKECKKHKH